MPDGKKQQLSQVAKVLTQIPLMQFYHKESLNNDFSNFWGPNMKCLELMLRECRFSPESAILNGERGIFVSRVVDDKYAEYHLNLALGIK